MVAGSKSSRSKSTTARRKTAQTASKAGAKTPPKKPKKKISKASGRAVARNITPPSTATGRVRKTNKVGAPAAKSATARKLTEGELRTPVPRILKAEYKRRRARLMAMMDPGSIALVPAARRLQRTRVTDYPFRQDSDFYYLTGFDEPDGLLVLAPGRLHGEVIVFCNERDPLKEQWDGEIAGPERIISMLGLDDAFPVADMPDILPGLVEGRERIYVTLGEHPQFDAQLMRWVQRIRAREAGGAVPPGEFIALKHLLHELRLYKSAAELRVMQRAADITCEAHARAMRACRPGLTEASLEAELTYEFMRRGARHPAYSSIVGSGTNACVMHYMANRSTLKDGELVLIDAGAEYAHYAADVTRTFPINGRFSATQQALYEVVLTAQQEAIAAATPANHFNEPHEAAVLALVQGLLDLGILKGSLAELIESGAYLPLCPNKTSHWLGIDVHDVGDYRVDGEWRALEAGMVLTIEPGLYIPPAAPGIGAKWRGLGIRIEDDVLIEPRGNRVLTEAAPKLPREVQKMMRRKL